MRKFDFSTILPLLALLTALGLPPAKIYAADLEPKTVKVFNHYVDAAEARIAKELAQPGAFLHIEGLPEPQRSQVLASIRKGEIYMDRLATLDASGSVIEAPDALIHHWIGAVFIPGTNLKQVLDLVQDYNHHQDIYQPEVIRSKLIQRDGDNFKIFYRLRKKKVITVTLNTDHDVQYFPIDSMRCRSRSVATRIAEVENAGQPTEGEKPVGHDDGFLWRLNSYWRFEEKDQGVYLEVESISLTRDIPTGLGWLVKPFVTSIPRESLLMTLGDTREAVEKKR